MSKFFIPIISIFFIISCEPKEKDKDFEWVISDSSRYTNSAYSQHIYSLDKKAKLTIHHEKYNERHTDKDKLYLSGFDFEIYDQNWIKEVCYWVNAAATTGRKEYKEGEILLDARKHKKRTNNERRFAITFECDEPYSGKPVRVYNLNYHNKVSLLYSLGLDGTGDTYNYLSARLFTKGLKNIIFPIPDEGYKAEARFRDFREESKSYAASIQEYSVTKKNKKNQECADNRAWRDYYLKKGDFGMFNAYIDELLRLGC